MDEKLRRRLGLVLALMAVTYAAMACLHTIADPDTGWHMATGRYYLQHHTIPTTDVLSYTSAGAPWAYPVFAGAILYKIFTAFGYAGFTWFCVISGALLTLYLLRRTIPGGSLSAAVLLVLAVPSLAYRMSPRPDLFTTFFFAIFLAELWRYHRGCSARLWLLPVVMLLWVNLHPGFIAGLGGLAAYVMLELCELPFSSLRADAQHRLARSWRWIAATVAATLLNPQGLGVLRFALAVAGFGGARTAPSVAGELTALPFSWHLLPQAFQLRDPDSSLCWLLAAAVLATAIALLRRQIGTALLLMISIAAVFHALRFQALFAIVVVIVAGTVLSQFASEHLTHKPALAYAGVALTIAIALLTSVRAGDLISNRYYVVSASTSDFGAGESWWFPERAATFIEREHLPGNIFQPYNIGGFAALRLGPHYLDYSDGRGISDTVLTEEHILLEQSPDSPTWQQVADRHGINVILLSLARYGGLGGFNLQAYCGAKDWQPVYLDEVSLVMLRRTVQNQPWLDHLELDCKTAPFKLPMQSFGSLYNFYANSGAVLYALSRDAEAEGAWRNALGSEPEDPNIHLFLAQLYQQQQHPAEAEGEYRTALARRESAAAWYALGRLLASEHRYAESEKAIAAAIPLTTTPASQYKALAQVQLRLNKPAAALANLAKAERAGPAAADPAPSACEFRAQLAEGRAEAAQQNGETARALELQQEAARQTPQSAARWKKLADLATAAGQPGLAAEAAQRANELANATH
jgi:tetratricopeptide (TPR) repeat protein